MGLIMPSRRVDDYSTKPAGSGFDLDNVKRRLTPIDEVAAEEAVPQLATQV
jgi:hypothetical protein